ncbi:DEAD/DEAH box helicase (plasmid) [Rossellomorea sp. AcN35-11]|nr:DEAD/DEAH box helicase [Rossellomorea aquimaris]WJV32339.1 DEAD/DEAH box helicase [Rossellomorea sp. AcN35-11]
MTTIKERPKYFRSTDLEKLNSKMIGRGAPDKKDNKGYNQPDFQTLRHYYFGLSNRQLAEVAKRLIKYCGTQLNLDPQLMKQSALYYYQRSQREYGEPVSVLIGKKYTALGFTYNQSFIEVIKSTTNHRHYIETNKAWVVHNDELLNVLHALEEEGAIVDYAKKHLYMEGVLKDYTFHQKNTPNPTQAGNKNNKPKKLLKITAEEYDLESIAIRIPDNTEIKKAIKKLKFPLKINNSDTHWRIAKFEISRLLQRLPNNLEVRELQKHVPAALIPVKLNPQVYANGPIKPFPHQVEASEFLLTKKRALLADDQGTGKTISSIMALKQIKGKKLIVVPASLKPNWRKEITTLDQNATVDVISGSNWIEPTEWTVINYDILDRHIDSILKADYSVVAFDEAHKIRGLKTNGEPGTKAADMALKIAHSIDYCFLLTGTPIVNKVKDIYNILKAIGHPIAYDFYWFAHRYCGAKRTGFGLTIDGASKQKELHKQMNKVKIRRTKAILNLPAKKRHFIPVKVSLEAYYKKIEEYMNERQYLDDDKKKLVELGKARLELAKEKVKYAIAYAEKALNKGKSVVLFTNYKSIANEIVEYFGEDTATKINGDCTEKQKDTAVEEFQAGKKKILVGNYIAAGVGLTLTKSHFMIKVDFDWLPANHLQAEDRIHRITASEECHIYYLYTEAAIEKIVVNSLQKKLDNISIVVDGEENAIYTDVAEELNAAVDEELKSVQMSINE